MDIYRTATLLALLLAMASLVSTTPYIVEAIPQRQDPDMPISDNVVIDEGAFLEILDKLSKKFNDPVIESYRKAIEDALDTGDYETANNLLQQLREYIEREYGSRDKELDNETIRDLAIISSSNITDNGVEVDIYKLLEEYAELVDNDTIASLTKELKEDPSRLNTSEYTLLIKTVKNLLGNNTETISFEELIGSSMEEFVPELTSFKPNLSLPKPVYNQPPIIPHANIPGVPVSVSTKLSPPFFINLDYLPLIMLSAIILYIGYRYRGSIIEYMRPRVRSFIAKTIVGLTDIVRKVEDPVIRLYSRALRYLVLIGYKKMEWETPREFLDKIDSMEYRSVLEKITYAYEERVYGGKTIGIDRVRELEEQYRRVFGGK